MATEIIVNSDPHETRVALMENNVVTELYIEREKDKGIVGNIYKGIVTKVLPGMQAAFVDIGLEKGGFLYVSDVEVLESMREDQKLADHEYQELEFEGPPGRPRRPPAPMAIEKILREGQEVLVQVSKEPMGSKGCRLTSYITLPGRYLVFMPGIDQIGISRRIEDEKERRRLRRLVRKLKAQGTGYIVRTVSEGVDTAEFETDINFLNTLWEKILEGSKKISAPSPIHSDLNLIHRTVRDLFTNDVDRMVLDSKEAYDDCLGFIETFYPHLKSKVELYKGKELIFDAYGIELEIERALGKKVWLKSGGYIVIDQTEALVTIDVNTGRYVGKRNPEETILTTNLEAAKEIVFQLRLRNIGGIIILDFIDMEKEESREKVFELLKSELKADRSRTSILKISELGLVEMTRKRVRDSLSRALCEPCPYCEGRGGTKSATTVCYEVLREIRRVKAKEPTKRKLRVNVHPNVADLLFDEESDHLDSLERELDVQVLIKADYDLHREGFEVTTI